jgi:hypothetical protein
MILALGANQAFTLYLQPGYRTFFGAGDVILDGGADWAGD